MLGAMYQLISVLHDQRSLPVSGSKPKILPAIATTTSTLPSAVVTSSGVFHDSRMPPARQTSAPVLTSSAMSDSLSTLALISTRFLYSTGEFEEPQPLSSSPTE